MNATARLLPDGTRLHLHHGPIDLIIGADGERERAFAVAFERFRTILEELVVELGLLKTRSKPDALVPRGAVAKQMHRAVRPFQSDAFVTPMAAVAGSVADTILQAMRTEAQLERAFVNNGGDIALFLTPDTQFSMVMVSHDGHDLGRINVKDTDPVRGIATSGRHGRSLSRGIADSVTVLAKTAAKADVAATLIANHVDLPGHPGVTRQPASTVADDSDLGELPVVTHCGRLSANEADQALETGLNFAEHCAQRKLIDAAALFLHGHSRATRHEKFQNIQRIPTHA